MCVAHLYRNQCPFAWPAFTGRRSPSHINSHHWTCGTSCVPPLHGSDVRPGPSSWTYGTSYVPPLHGSHWTCGTSCVPPLYGSDVRPGPSNWTCGTSCIPTFTRQRRQTWPKQLHLRDKLCPTFTRQSLDLHDKLCPTFTPQRRQTLPQQLDLRDKLWLECGGVLAGDCPFCHGNQLAHLAC